MTELTFLANELLYRDFIGIVGKYNNLRTKNFKIFVGFVAHDFPVINYYKNGSLLFFNFWKAVSVCSCNWNSLPSQASQMTVSITKFILTFFTGIDCLLLLEVALTPLTEHDFRTQSFECCR